MLVPFFAARECDSVYRMHANTTQYSRLLMYPISISGITRCLTLKHDVLLANYSLQFQLVFMVHIQYVFVCDIKLLVSFILEHLLVFFYKARACFLFSVITILLAC